jgi:hypothetical protein
MCSSPPPINDLYRSHRINQSCPLMAHHTIAAQFIVAFDRGELHEE